MLNGTLLAPGQFGFGKARAVSTPCFYIFTPIQNVPFWAGLSQASSLVSEIAGWGEGNPFEEGEFWAKLQQLTWPNAVLKDGMKGERSWGCAGACWAVSLGTGMGKQPRQRGCPLCWAAALPCLRSY